MSKIEWTDESWNPVRGCTPVSEGCRNCWAARMAQRHRAGAYRGLVQSTGWPGFRNNHWSGRVDLIADQLGKPLRWRKPRRIAVALMGDLFHEKLSDHEIALVFETMALAPQHTYQVLTKRAGRMLDWFRSGPGLRFPNVWLGVSVEDQATADERIPLLLQTPAAVCWVSYEPALGPVDFSGPLNGYPRQVRGREVVTHEMAIDAGEPEMEGSLYCDEEWEQTMPSIDWLPVGGESGPGARPCNVEWIRSAVRQCREAGVPVFVKQLGACYEDPPNGVCGHAVKWPYDTLPGGPTKRLKHSKGGEPAEWPSDLRVREFPP